MANDKGIYFVDWIQKIKLIIFSIISFHLIENLSLVSETFVFDLYRYSTFLINHISLISSQKFPDYFLPLLRNGKWWNLCTYILREEESKMRMRMNRLWTLLNLKSSTLYRSMSTIIYFPFRFRCRDHGKRSRKTSHDFSLKHGVSRSMYVSM